MTKKTKGKSIEEKKIKFDIDKSMTDEEINKFAKDMVENRIFVDRQLTNPDLLGVVFMPLALMEGKDIEFLQKHNPAMVYAYYKDQVGDRSINGYPFFGACNFVWKASDVKKIFRRVKEIDKFMNKEDGKRKTGESKQADGVLSAQKDLFTEKAK